MQIKCGIHRLGFSIPRRSLAHQETATAWDRGAVPGNRRVAGFDEDALTLGVNAARQAMQGYNCQEIGMIIFASTTSPFQEKTGSATIAEVLGVGADTQCIDLGQSLRAGTQALALAMQWVSDDNSKKVLVVAADKKIPPPGDPEEYLYGHAGVAVIIGAAAGSIAIIQGSEQRVQCQFDRWQRSNERFWRSSDTRFSRANDYAAPMGAVLDQLLKKLEWSATDVHRYVLYSPDAKSGVSLLKQRKIDIRSTYCDLVSAKMGLTGVPHTLLMLAAALELAEVGEKLVMLGYGDGADAFALEMQQKPQLIHFRRALGFHYPISYAQYIRMNDLFTRETQVDEGFTSEIMFARNKSLWYGLQAKQCQSCEQIMTLPLPNCPHCQLNTQWRPVQLTTTGKVFAITHEHYYPTPEPPLGMAIVDLDNGGRLTLQVADENQPLQINDSVTLVFRSLHGIGGRPNYFWKARSTNLPEDGPL